MVGGIERDPGGIVSLAALIDEHGRALNYDLVTRVGVSLYDLPGPLSWADLRDFVSYLDAGSALVSEIDPEAAGWQGDEKVPMLLAHIADLLAGLSYGYTVSHLKKGARRPKAPEPIPRPGVKPKRETQHWGSGGLPIAEFTEWWDRIYDEDEEQ
jgi:hypothetical protein